MTGAVGGAPERTPSSGEKAVAPCMNVTMSLGVFSCEFGFASEFWVHVFFLSEADTQVTGAGWPCSELRSHVWVGGVTWGGWPQSRAGLRGPPAVHIRSAWEASLGREVLFWVTAMVTFCGF